MFKWKDEYSCNITEVDNQHRKLFELGKKIYETATLQDNFDHYDEIMSFLEELTEYTQYHFGYEEKLMVQYQFPGYETHKFEHDFFVKKLQRIARKDLEENQGEALMEIVNFVADWVGGHILQSYMGYRDFFNCKGVY